MRTLKNKITPQRNIMTILGEEDETMPFYWDGMPEYNNVQIKPYKSVKVHFRNKEDYERFAALMEQDMTEKTIYIWYPEKENNNKRFAFYIDEEDLDKADDFAIKGKDE